MAAKRKATKQAEPQKKRSSTATGIRKREAENYKAQKNQRKQEIKAIILFAVSVLVLFLVLIKGSSIWLWAHNLIFGLFGICSFLVPIVMIYVAVKVALNKMTGNMSEKLVESSLLVLCLTTLINVILYSTENIQYTDYLVITTK